MSGRLLFPLDPEGPVDNPTMFVGEKSLTRQSEAAACDINEIMKRAEQTGLLPLEMRVPTYGDVSELGSFREAMEVVGRATEAFMALPVKVRKRFSNDPVEFVDFCSDPANRGELESLGLVEKAAAPVAPAVAPAEPA